MLFAGENETLVGENRSPNRKRGKRFQTSLTRKRVPRRA